MASTSGLYPCGNAFSNIFNQGLFVYGGPVVFPKGSIDPSAIGTNSSGLGFVDLLNDQFIQGTKTFSKAPKSNVNPTQPNDLATKAYVDSVGGGGGGGGINYQPQIDTLNQKTTAITYVDDHTAPLGDGTYLEGDMHISGTLGLEQWLYLRDNLIVKVGGEAGGPDITKTIYPFQLGFLDGLESDLQTDLNDLKAKTSQISYEFSTTDTTSINGVLNTQELNAHGSLGVYNYLELYDNIVCHVDRANPNNTETVTVEQMALLSSLTSEVQVELDKFNKRLAGINTNASLSETQISNNLILNEPTRLKNDIICDWGGPITTVTSQQVACLQGVTSSIQNQLNAKVPTINPTIDNLIVNNISYGTLFSVRTPTLYYGTNARTALVRHNVYNETGKHVISSGNSTNTNQHIDFAVFTATGLGLGITAAANPTKRLQVVGDTSLEGTLNVTGATVFTVLPTCTATPTTGTQLITKTFADATYGYGGNITVIQSTGIGIANNLEVFGPAYFRGTNVKVYGNMDFPTATPLPGYGASTTVTPQEMLYSRGVTSSIQDQINALKTRVTALENK